jgi:excisionase family DNA binding protein
LGYLAIVLSSERIKRRPDIMEKKTLTVVEAARLLGIGKNLAYEAVKRGEIPCLRVGKRLLVPVAALEELLAGKASPVPSRLP